MEPFAKREIIYAIRMDTRLFLWSEEEKPIKQLLTCSATAIMLTVN